MRYSWCLGYHESCGLLVSHNDNIGNLHTQRPVQYKGNDIGDVFRMQCIHPFIYCVRPLLVAMKTHFTEWGVYNPRLNGSHLDIRINGIDTDPIAKCLYGRFGGAVKAAPL